MAEVLGVFSSPNDGSGYSRQYEAVQWDRSDVIRPAVPIESVLAIQSLAMGFLRHRTRTHLPRVDGQKRHVFGMLNNLESDDNSFYDGSSEEYMSCRVAKTDFDQWRMRVRFRKNVLTEETKNSSSIDEYMFDWLRSGNLHAWFANCIVKSRAGGTKETWTNIHPITEDDITALGERMSNFVETVNPGSSTSIYAPKSAKKL